MCLIERTIASSSVPKLSFFKLYGLDYKYSTIWRSGKQMKGNVADEAKFGTF